MTTTTLAAFACLFAVGCVAETADEELDTVSSEWDGANAADNAAGANIPDANVPDANGGPNACIKHEVITDACHDVAYFQAAAAQLCGNSGSAVSGLSLGVCFASGGSNTAGNGANNGANTPTLYDTAEFACCATVAQCDANTDPNCVVNGGSNTGGSNTAGGNGANGG